ncbi:MAG: hypothetical protein COV45_05720 [Deltaproteobacteria bacterium CG11_big_fil_rev_8_21_14_0_20_47_16]|nr:MAG: hypothetical protein COV45_05720 [Deltaproteobacteria bacterium CG11_big_fil_rev_8_21_14_0_20_47_16]
MRNVNYFLNLLIVLVMFGLSACSGCQKEATSVQVDGRSLQLATPPPSQADEDSQPAGPRIITIVGKPYHGEGAAPTSAPAITPAPQAAPVAPAVAEGASRVPPGTTEEESLTKKLHDKLKEANIAFSDKNPPKIYVSGQSLDEFTGFYEAKGQAVSRMSVPASVLVRPLLQEHPELAGKVNVEALDKVIINQVVVEGTGVSAADKYIDPDTFQVVDKLFVTEMPPNLGKKDPQ